MSKKGKVREVPVKTEENLLDAVEESDKNSISLNQQTSKSRKPKEKSKAERNKEEDESKAEKPKAALPPISSTPSYQPDFNSITKVNFTFSLTFNNRFLQS